MSGREAYPVAEDGEDDDDDDDAAVVIGLAVLAAFLRKVHRLA